MMPCSLTSWHLGGRGARFSLVPGTEAVLQASRGLHQAVASGGVMQMLVLKGLVCLGRCLLCRLLEAALLWGVLIRGL